MRKLLLLLAAPAALASTLLPAGVANAAPVESSELAAQLNEKQHEIADRVNGLRAAHGARTLVISGALTDNANRWTVNLAEGNRLQHQSMSASMLGFGVRAENVAYAPNSEFMFRLLESSPTHFNNMINPVFHNIGVGWVERNGGFYSAQEFG